MQIFVDISNGVQCVAANANDEDMRLEADPSEPNMASNVERSAIGVKIAECKIATGIGRRKKPLMARTAGINRHALNTKPLAS